METTTLNSKTLQVRMASDKFVSVSHLINTLGQVGNVKHYSISRNGDNMAIILSFEDAYRELHGNHKFSNDRSSPWFLQPKEVVEVLTWNIYEYILKHEEAPLEEKQERVFSWLNDIQDKIAGTYEKSELDWIMDQVSNYVSSKYPYLLSDDSATVPVHIGAVDINQNETVIDPETQKTKKVTNVIQDNTGKEIVEVQDNETQQPEYIEKEKIQNDYKPVLTTQ